MDIGQVSIKSKGLGRSAGGRCRPPENSQESVEQTLSKDRHPNPLSPNTSYIRSSDQEAQFRR